MKNKILINYSVIDILKFFFSCCVVLIHTGFSRKIDNGFYLQEILFRLAVPFFFIVSGYFFSLKKITKESLCCRLKQLIIPYIIFGLLYILLQYYMDALPLTFVFEQVSRLCLLSVGASVVWFTGSLIFSMILIFHIQDNKRVLIISIIFAFLLYLLGLSFTTYSFIPKNYFFTELASYFASNLYHNRNPLFCGYLYFGIGYIIGRFYKDFKFKNWQNVILVFIMIILTFLESNFVYQNISKLVEYDFLVMHIPLIILIFLICKNINIINIDTKFFRQLSIIIFYIHMAIIYLYRYLILKINLINLDINSIKFDFIVLITTIIFSFIVVKCKNLFVRKKVIK